MISLASVCSDGELVAFDAGPDGRVYLVFALEPLDYRIERPGAGSFAKTMPDRPQRYRVAVLREAKVDFEVLVEEERFNIHAIQPLGDELLLVCVRSHFRGPDDLEKNGRVYTRNGKFVRAMLLGDGIQSVQTTSDGIIWTSFFDEGVFGNYGWQNPVGTSGLVAWDASGKKLYEFQPRPGLDSICDCCAMNVESDQNTWFYYYTQFPLVHLHRRAVQSVWQVPIGGSDAFAVSSGHALFRGGYKDHDVYQLLSLGADRAVTLAKTFELRRPDGKKLIAERVAGRGDTIHFLSGACLYRVDVRTALGA